MDFHSMKRKQLQALCKKHKIPANLSNLEMANRLTEFLKERENPVIEIESDDKVLKDKKVRFSPENQVIEFTRSLGIKRRSRRNSVYCREGNSSVEIVESGEWNKATVNRRGKAMRTGESNLIETEVKQTKRGVKSVKCIDGQKIAAADSFDDAQLEEGDVVRSDREISLRGKMVAEGVEYASKRERKRAKCDDKRDDKASASVNGHQVEIVNNHGRVTRSRAQKLTEAPAVEEKRGSKVVKNIGKVAGRTETDGNRENSTDSLIKRGDEGVEKSASVSDERMKRNGKGLKEILVNKQIPEEHVTVEPQLLLRRSKRKANMVGESETLATDARNNEDDEVKGSRKTSRLLTSDDSKVDAVEPRRSNRRKTFDDQNSTSNIVEVENGTFPLEVDVKEPIELNITDMDKNDPEAQVHSQMEDSGYNNKINDQALAEGLNASADSFLLGDQTDAETDLKVAETEADEHVQPCLRVVGHHNDLDHLETSGMTRHHGDNVAEADEDGCLKDLRNASNHLSAIDMPDLSNGEKDARIVSPDRGIIADEYSVVNSAVHVAPIAICTASTDANLKRDHEDDQITKKDDHIYESTNSEAAETCESESSKGHKRKCDEDGEFSLNKLFDEEGRCAITPQERENFFGEHSVKDFNDQGMSHCSPSLALSSGDHEANISAEGGETYNFKNKQSQWTEADQSGCLKSHRKSSNSQETNPSTPSSVSETQEKQKSILAKSNALADTNQRKGAWSNTNELAGNAVCFLKSSMENISQVLEGLSAHEDVNHANCGIDKEASAEAIISDVQSYLGDVKFQDSVETEHRHENLLAMQTDACGKATHATSRQSWTETELQNLFGTSYEDDHPGLGDTFYQGSETTNMSMTRNKLTASNCDSLTKKQEKEMDGESSNECSETKNKNVGLSTGFDAEIYENEFKVLSATQVKIMTPSKTEEAYSDDRVLDGSVASINECSDAMKENVATESTSNEKTQNVGYEVENNSSIGASLSDNGGDDSCENINEFESYEMLNTSTRVLSEAEDDGCEALKDQLTQNKEEYLDENIPIMGEDMEEHVIPLVQSCLNDEATNSPRDLYELESCLHMSETDSCKSKAHNKSEGEMTQSTTELSDVDLQKFDVLENSHLLTGCSLDGNILRETSIETSSDPEVAINGSSEKDVIEKGISPGLFLKASLDCEDIILESDDQYEAKKLYKEDNPKSSRDISDELHSNSEVAIQESVSIGCNSCKEVDQLPSSDVLESTCKEAKGMETATQSLYSIDVAAEHGSFVCGAVSGLLSCSAMHNMLIDTVLGESLSCKTSVDHKSVQEMTHCSDAAVKSSDADLQKSNISKNSQDVIDEGTYLRLSPKVSTVYNELTQSINADDLNGAKICDEIHSKAKSSQDMPDELHINSKVAIVKSLSASDHQSEVACCLELETMLVETKETGMTTQDLNNIVAPTEHGSPVCGTVSSILSNSEMNNQRDSSITNLDVGKPVFNMSVGNNKKDIEIAEENSTAEMVQFSIQELHFEENVEDFKNDEEIDNDSESTEENINSLSGTPNNMDKHEGCQDVLIETALGESLSCNYSIDHKSEQEMTQCNEAAVELSDADLQKSNISKNSQDIVDEGTCLLLSPKASTVYNELTQSTNTDDLNGAKICDEIPSNAKFSQDMPDESHTNSKVAIPKSLSDSDHQSEEAGLACCLELESTFVETERTGTTTQDLNNIVAPTEHGSPVCGTVSSILSNSEMHLYQRDDNSSINNLDVGKHVFNTSIDNDKKDIEKAEENSTAEMVQSPIQELHFEENVEDFKNDTPTISNLPPTGYNKILKESDVADTIKEYVDSESSLSVMFENSSASLPSDIPAHTDERIATSKHEDNMSSVDCFDEKIQEPEEALFLSKEPEKGTAVELESQKKIESEDWQSSSSKELGSIMRKNARTILIHGTPGKLLSMADMKENMPAQKRSNAGDITAVRPAKRRALRDLQWK